MNISTALYKCYGTSVREAYSTLLFLLYYVVINNIM